MKTSVKREYRFEQSWGEQGEAKGQLNQPSGVAIGDTGRVYVADSGNDRIQCFTLQGEFLYTWGHTGSDDGEFRHPYGIAVTPPAPAFQTLWIQHIQSIPHIGAWPPGILSIVVGFMGNPEHVYVTDTGNHRVQLFNEEGGFIIKWGQRGTLTGQFLEPRGCAISSLGHVYVVDYRCGVIQSFTWDGKLLYRTSVNLYASSLALDRVHSVLYIGERSRIRRLSLTDHLFLSDWLPSNMGLSIPVYALAVDDPYMIASDADNIISQITYEGNGVWGMGCYEELGCSLALATHPSFPYLVVVDSDHHRINVLLKTESVTS